jgi:hypothetical protein
LVLRNTLGCALLLAVTSGACSEFSIQDEDDKVVARVVLEDTFTQAPLPKVDVLWVIDNTPSMIEEQSALSSAIGEFSSRLDQAGLAWQVGVVHTDITSNAAGVLQGQPWIITPGLADPATTLAEAASVGTLGQPPEAGLGAAYLALTDPLASDENRGFRREDAALHVVVVSDGDDDSGDILGDHPADAFLAFLLSEQTRTGRPARLSAIVGDTPDGCTGPGGNALPGTRYIRIADDTDGIVGSICEADYLGIAAALADDSLSWPDTFSLSADPIPGTVRVEVDGVRLDTGWTLEIAPPAVRFDSPPEPGVELRIRYTLDAG